MNFKIFVNMLAVLFMFEIAPAAELSGKVVDSDTGEPLPGVIVTITDPKMHTVTDLNGIYTLRDMPFGEREIQLKVIGYESLKETITFDNKPSIKLTHRLVSSPWEMEKVVVTATRREQLLKDVPVTTELITIEDLEKTGALTVDEALESHIGAIIYDDLSGRGVSLQGIDPTRVLVLVDGNRVIGRVRGSLDMGQIPLNNVKQIEIVKGTGSTLYGSDAIGGVVNIITKKPSGKTGYSLYSSYGSYNSWDIQAGLNSPLIGKGLNLTTKYEHTDGFDLVDSTEHTNGIEEIDRFNSDAKTVFRLSPGLDLELSAGFMAEKKSWVESETIQIGVDRDTTYDFDDYEYNYRYDGRAKFHWNIDEKANFSLGLFGSYYDHKWEKFTRAGVQDDSSVSVDDIEELSIAYDRKIKDGFFMTFGGNVVSQRLKSEQLSISEKRINYGNLYLQSEFEAAPKITILPGIRWEHHQTFGEHFNPSVSGMWDACSYFSLRASIGRGYRVPSIKELYFEFDHSAAGYLVIGGGDDLEPETSNNYSVTAEISYNRKAVHRFTLFRNDLENLIDFSDGDFSNPTYWRGIYYYENILKARTQGFEWESEIELTDYLDLSISYTYLSAVNLTDDSKLLNRPQHMIKFVNSYDCLYLDTKFNFWGSWHDKKLWTTRAETPDRTSDDYAPSRFVLNLSATKKIANNVSLSANIENLTNDTNATYGYWPERSYKLNLSYSFNRSK